MEAITWEKGWGGKDAVGWMGGKESLQAKRGAGEHGICLECQNRDWKGKLVRRSIPHAPWSWHKGHHQESPAQSCPDRLKSTEWKPSRP